MKDLTKPTVVGEVPGIAGKGMGIEAIEAVGDLNLLVNTARNSKGWTEAPPKVAPADTNAPATASTIATGIASAASIRGSARSSFASRSCARVLTSRHFSSRAKRPRRRPSR